MTLKQTLYGEISEPEGINHPVRNKVQQLSADGYSQLTVAGIIAERLIRPQHMPSGRERLVHGRKRFGIVYVCSGILTGHRAPLAVHCRRERDLSLSAVGACCYL